MLIYISSSESVDKYTIYFDELSDLMNETMHFHCA